ncbi:DJ-1/PfpI family protein [Flexibacterium corallicola]|uniref:DJ-1/PfpI family protein n=1 Tax=Flexibacterium corallicola TaxID=3037259 RepID=UPI00286F449A|nr:DJ-1/PfpI family protein [Pseudovibrio sp. M1P-2-3]
MSKLALIVTEGFADWEYALIAGTGGPYYGIEIRFFTPQAGEVTSFGGLKTVVPNDLEALLEWLPETVVVVGGSIWDTERAPDISKVLVACYENGATIGGICGGTLALARAGLLDSVAHTSNSVDFLAQNAKGYVGSKYYNETPAVVSQDRIITAAGTAPVTFACAALTSAGVSVENVNELKQRLAAEHG